MLSQPETVSRRWTRHARLSVRELMIVVLIIGGSLGWIVRGAQTQCAAVAAIRQAGGSVRYDSGWTENSAPEPREPWAPDWLVNLIGIDYFAHVYFVSFYSTGSDAELVHVGRLSRLVTLVILNTKVTDAGLAHLRGLSRLSALYLDRSQITDAGLEYLDRLAN
jgi:hypothetical protein